MVSSVEGEEEGRGERRDKWGEVGYNRGWRWEERRREGKRGNRGVGYQKGGGRRSVFRRGRGEGSGNKGRQQREKREGGSRRG